MDNKIAWSEIKKHIDNFEDNILWFDENIDVTMYMSLREKYNIASEVSDKFNEELLNFNADIDKMDESALQNIYDKYIMFDAFFGYTNVSFRNEEKNNITYDLIMVSGLYDYIYDKIGKDFIRLKDICDRVSGINSLPLMIMMLNVFSHPMTAEEAKKVKDILDTVDPKVIRELHKVEVFNNPTLGTISKSVEKEAYKDFKAGMDKKVDKK